LPVYCETWLYGYGNFPAEPLNAGTSLVPVLLGALAFFFLIRRREGGPVVYLLAALLIATGLGSTAWHATREQVALTADTVPGLFYFAVMLFFWIYYLGGRLWGFLPLAAIALLIHFLWPLSHEALFITLGTFVAILTFGLLGLTYRRRPIVFKLALTTVGFAALALALRSIDLHVCKTMPFGTHFFWHIFLGIAAFAGIRMMVAARDSKIAAISQTAK